jgi:UDP-glucose 4-epimerase
MNFAVTGGAGFIGSHLTKYLISEGHNVTVIDNLFRGKLSNLDEVKDRINFIKLDILDIENLRKVLQNVDGIFHQAALTSVPESYKKEDEYKNVNIKGTENIFKIAKEFEIKVVYASSSSVYGDIKNIPITEDFERKPINPYGLTKLEDEYLAEAYSKSNVKIIGLRYFNVFGVGQTLDYAGVITKFFEKINQGKSPVVYGDGLQIRDFIFVNDVARANVAAMISKVDHGFFNVGTGKTISIKDLANLMIKILEEDLEPIFDKIPDGDVKLSQADVSLAKNMLDWQSITTLEDGLRTMF